MQGAWGPWHLSRQPAAKESQTEVPSLRFLWQLSSVRGFPGPLKSVRCAVLWVRVPGGLQNFSRSVEARRAVPDVQQQETSLPTASSELQGGTARGAPLPALTVQPGLQLLENNPSVIPGPGMILCPCIFSLVVTAEAQPARQHDGLSGD